MVFLKVNDWQLDLGLAAGYEPKIVGGRRPAYDGTPITARSGWPRRWRFATTPLGVLDAEGLIGVVMGKGEHWRYDSPWESDDTTIGSDFYSTIGTTPTGTTEATVVPGYDLQDPPVRVYEEASGEPESKFGGGALRVDPSTENLLGADSRDAENAPTGFTVYLGATLAAETTIRVQGSKSLKVTTSSTLRSGFYVSKATAPSGTTTYTGSFYLYSTEALPIRVVLNDISLSTIDTYTTTANVWERFEITHTTSASPTFLRLYVQHNAAVSGKIFYCDMLQIENTDYATAWVDGTRASGILRHDLSPIPRNLTVSMWARGPTASPTGNSYLWIIRGGDITTKSYVYARRQTATNNIQFLWFNGSSSDSLTYGSPWDGDWHHVAFVMCSNLGGSSFAGIYYDGTLVASDSAASNYPILNTHGINRLYTGSQAGSGHWIGSLDEVLVLPFAMGADQISALANRTLALPPYPRVELTGDFGLHLDEQGVVAEGVDSPRARYVGLVDSGTYKGYLRRVDFELQSVGDLP
jgi:hypothetical protein